MDEPDPISISLPGDAIITCRIVIIGYIDGNGKQCYVSNTDSELPISSVLGLIELVKHDMLGDNITLNGEDGDGD